MANTAPVSTASIPAQQGAASLGSVDIPSDTREIKLVDIKGEVFVQKSGKSEFVAVTDDAILDAGDTIKTGNGSCRLVIDGETHLTLQANASLLISQAIREPQTHDESTKLLLQNGKLMVKLAKLKGGSSFEVSTPTAVAVVRGTTFFLNVGIFQGKENTQMYVDESKGGVLFRNLLNGRELLVPAFALSNAFADGRLDEPRQLTSEEKEAFLKNFESNTPGASQQFGIEEVPGGTTPPPIPDALNNLLPEGFEEPQIKDALLDKLAEQNIAGSNGFIPSPSLPNPGLVPDPDDETTEPKPDTNPPPKDDTDPDGEVDPDPLPDTDIPAITVQDVDIILDEVDDILADQGFDIYDANQARVQDAQAGKVFKDVHGNRVRTDQFIYHQGQIVSLLSLTQRPGEYQNGVTAVNFLTILNRPLVESDGPIKDLPWNDWMNVVTFQEMGLSASSPVYEQFIVHEHLSRSSEGPTLFPMGFSVNFATTQASVGFVEIYTDPFFIATGQGNFWAQGLTADMTWIGTDTDENVFSMNLFGQNFTEVNGFSANYFSREGAQTAGFATDLNIPNLDTEAGINYFRTSLTHPAFVEQQFGDDRFLNISFLPINDQGQVIDAPGFNVHGIRDLVHPNRLVNGGNYNLEVLLVYGIGDTVSFDEQFRIDAIITPEIFGDFGLKGPSGTVDRSTVFPASLDNDSQNV